MALTNAEKVKAYQDRKRAKEREEQRKPDASHWYVQGPFSEFFDNHSESFASFTYFLDFSNIEAPSFEDGPPESASGQIPFDINDPNDQAFFTGIGRAELAVTNLLEAARVLATIVNEFKIKQVDDRIAEIEKTDLADPGARKKAMAQIVSLNKIRDELGKQVRWTVPQWKVKGD